MKRGSADDIKTRALGIIGSGQLAQMLAYAAADQQISIAVLSETSRSPASFSPAEVFCSPLTNLENLKKFLSQCRQLTFENEFVDCDLMEQATLAIAPAHRPLIYPSFPTLRKLRDKLEQKKLLRELEIPTSGFSAFRAEEFKTIEDWRLSLQEKFGERCVLKWSCFGYDGKGTFFLNSQSSHHDFETFIKLGLARGAELFAEEHISFQCEVAQSLARTIDQKTLLFPLVVSQQERGICSEVRGPAKNFNISPDILQKSQNILRKIAESLDYVGVLSVEFFLTDDGEVYVNEIAPRVHNSAHYSQDAAPLSQFAAHVLAGIEKSSFFTNDEISTKPFFGMLNILGPDSLNYERPTEVSPMQIPDSEIFLHWYSKTRVSPQRKLGHINYFADSLDEFTRHYHRAKEIRAQLLQILTQETKGMTP